MKKIFYLLTVLVFATTSAFADNNYTYVWNHTIDGLPAAGDNVLGMAKASDGNVFVLSQFCTGSSTASVASGYRDAKDISNFLNLFIDGEKAVDDQGNEIIGNDYKTEDGNSTAENALLQKIDPTTGKILWNVWTDRGDVYSENCHILPTKDGGAVLVLFYRHWAEGKGSTLFRIHGTGGTVNSIDTDEGTWTDADGNMHIYYMPIYVKVDKDGKIVSSLLLWHPQPVKDLTYNPGWLSYTRGATQDEDGNIYICGSFRTTLIFDTEDGMEEEITAKNVTGWTGDDQTENGDLYIAKFDENGQYLASYTAEGTASLTYLRKIAYKDGKIYGIGIATGDGTAIKIGDTSLTFPTTGQSLFVTAFDTDLQPQFAKAYTATNINALHTEDLQIFDGNLYATGSIMSRTSNGTLTDMDDASTVIFKASKNTHTGFVIEFSPEDGSFIASGKIDKTTGISKIYGLFRTLEDGKYYLNGWGYDMTNGGANIYKFDATPDDSKTLANTEFTNVVNRGQGFAMVQKEPVVIGDKVILMSRFGRANNGNQTFTLLGDVTTAAVNCWAVVVAAYTNPNAVDESETTGIRNITVEPAETSKRIYNISGQYVGDDADRLPSGIYIKAGKKFIVR